MSCGVIFGGVETMFRGDVRVVRGWVGLVKAVVRVSSGRRMTDFMVRNCAGLFWLLVGKKL